MADAKKPAAKKPAAPSGGDESEYVFFAVIAVVVLFIIIPAVIKYFGFGEVKYSVPENLDSKAAYAFSTFLEIVSSISIFISLLLVMGIIYTKFKYKETMEEFKAAQGGKKVEVEHVDPSQFQSAGPDPRWQEIERHMSTNSQAEWRVAIIESDIILYDMLDQMGYEGDTVAEKLKKVDKVNFATLDDAWRAHKIRNIIAHEGANYELSRDEADRTIRLFKKVFEEFYFI